MKHLFAGALALSLLVAGAASAQTDQPRQDQPGGYQQDQRHGDDRGQQQQDNRDHRGGYYHANGHRACHWRHHQRVCRWYH
jgi:Ni/Co efflux regulator RcnB